MIPSILAKEMVTDQHRYEDYNTGRERGGHAGVRGDEGRQNLREKTELGVGKSIRKATLQGDGYRLVGSMGRGAGVYKTQKRRERPAKGVAEAES